MTYEINGTGIPLQPTEGRWMPRKILGLDGNGRAVYPPTREFQLYWGLADPSDVWQLQEWWQTIGATGTVTVALPHYAFPTYTFYTYTGVLIQEPEFRHYFSQHHTEVLLMITNITTEEV